MSGELHGQEARGGQPSCHPRALLQARRARGAPHHPSGCSREQRNHDARRHSDQGRVFGHRSSELGRVFPSTPQQTQHILGEIQRQQQVRDQVRIGRVLAYRRHEIPITRHAQGLPHNMTVGHVAAAVTMIDGVQAQS